MSSAESVRATPAQAAGPTAAFWEERFARGELPWDRGAPGPWIEAWRQQSLLVPGSRVAVPGCGSGHDVLALAQAGLAVTALDVAEGALKLARERLDAAAVSADLVRADVLSWQPPQAFDLVYDQTLWCALHPDHWQAWAAQLARWLRPGGHLLLLAMQALRPSAADGRIEGPPYHLDVHMLRALLPPAQWVWPKPPYPQVPHRDGKYELALALVRR